MKKHLCFKASILLTVMFFHSFVLVPKSYATAPASAAGLARLAFDAMSPSQLLDLAVANEGKAMLLGMRLAGGIGLAYYLYDSGALSKLANWWNSSHPSTYPYTFPVAGSGLSSDSYTPPGGVNSYRISESGGVWIRWLGPPGQFAGSYQGTVSTEAEARAWMQGVAVPPVIPSSPYDYTDFSIDPGFTNGTIFGTPGGGSLLPSIGSAATPPQVVSVQVINPADVDAIKAGMGLTSIDPNTGVQPNTVNDNTITQGDSNTSSLLGQIFGVLVSIKDYVSNLVGIKSGIDNVVLGINNQIGIDNQILGKVSNIDNALIGLNTTNATQESLATRLTSVKNLLLTKFPFSIVGVVTSPGDVAGGTYSIPDLHFPLDTIVSVDPMSNNEIHTWITWVRNLMALSLWAIFVLVMVRRVTQI